MLRTNDAWPVPTVLVFALVTACGSPPPSTSPLRAPPAALPVAVTAAPTGPGPKADLSVQLGGMRFGMTVDEFVAACRSVEGNATRLDEIALACSVAPAPLVAAQVELRGAVSGRFCAPGARLCELVYTFEGDAQRRDEQTAALVAMLVDKYGPPQSSTGPTGDDPMTRCRKDRAIQFAREWSFGPEQAPPHPPGRARLGFRCDLRVATDSHHLELVYDDEHGLRYRAAEHASRHDNY